MRVAVVGAGAIGTLIGHGLSKGGHEVTLLDVSSRVAQIRAAGQLRVISEDGKETHSKPALVTTKFGDAGIFEVVILATKSQDLPEIATGVMRLIDQESVIVTVQNGIPWWYLHNLESELVEPRIHCLDPDRVLERTIPLSQVIGCVAYPAAIMESDGRVRHVEGWRLPVGELDGATTRRVETVSRMFEDGSFKSRIIDDIRSEIWLKAWGALSINPVSALTRATMVDICTFPFTRDLIQKMMEEAMQVAEAFGASFRHTIEKRIEGARAVGAHKTSMLQDVECGRPIELDAVMLSVIELARMAGISTPTIQSIYACIALVNENLIQKNAERIPKAS